MALNILNVRDDMKDDLSTEEDAFPLPKLKNYTYSTIDVMMFVDYQ
jgi:hypothetical protein